MDVINPMAEKQKAKGLISMIIESRDILWVYPDIVQDERWEASKSKFKGKTCNAVTLTIDEDSMTLASLSDSEGEKLDLATQPATSQPVGTRSDKQYF